MTAEFARPNASVGAVQDSLFPAETAAKLSLAGRFGVPPFSFLDSTQGYWQERKNDWLGLGIRSEVGRTGDLVLHGPAKDSGFYAQKRAVEKSLGRELTTADFQANYYAAPDVGAASGTSVFDPVLCELVYRWFSPPFGRVLDPFAGGSVRGVVAAVLGYRYVGVDLRPEQVESNWAQLAAADESIPLVGSAEWVVGDSRRLDELVDTSAGVDLVFSCPPYFDLEVYSDDPADLSTFPSYEAFLKAYREIIALSVENLVENRFAVWVVSDIRDRIGVYRTFIPDTIRIFEEQGLSLYNEAVLVSPVASASIRAARQFQAGRKLVRRHQSVLCFFRGDPASIKETFGAVAVDEAWR